MKIKLLCLTLISVALHCFTALYAQDCGSLKYEILSGAKCNGAGQGGRIKVISPSECTLNAGYQFILWDSGSEISSSAPNSDIIDNVPPGSGYKITATKVSGCGCITLWLEGVTMPYAVTTDTSNTTVVICQGSSTVTVKAAAKNGTGPYTYRLYNGGGTLLETQSGAGQVILTTSAKSDTYTIRIKDNGCPSPDATAEYIVKLIDYNNIPSIITATATKLCPGGTINLTANYPGATAYRWTGPNGYSSSSNTVNISPAATTNSGTYTVSLSMPGCSSPDNYTESLNVDVSNPVEPNADPTVYKCINSYPPHHTYDLSNNAFATSPDYEPVWYGPNNQSVAIGTTAPTIRTDVSGTVTYYVSQRDKNFGCESNKVQMTVVVRDYPSRIGENNIDYCLDPSNPGSAMIIIKGAGNGREYGLYASSSEGTALGYGTSHNDTAYINVFLTVGTTYYVETTDEHSCTAQSRTPVNVPEIKPLIKVPTNDICLGESLTFSTVDSYPGRIVWTRPDKSQVKADLLTLNDTQLTGAGTYEVKVSVERWAGCLIRDSIKVEVHKTAAPIVSTANYDFCKGSDAYPMTATASPRHSLRWYDASGTLITESDGKPTQAPTPETTASGTFLYRVSQKDSVLFCESDKVTVTVLVRPVTPPIKLDEVTTCIHTVPFIQISHTTTGTIYCLYEAEHDVVPIANETGNGGNISFNHGKIISNNTNWYVSCKNPNECESDRTPIRIITENNIINREASNNLICEKGNGKLTATDIDGARYKWTKPDGTIIPNQQELEIRGVPDDMGVYTLTILTPDCDSISQDFKVSLGKPEKPDAPANVEYCQYAVAVPLTGTPSGGCSLVWYDADGTKLTEAPTPETSATGATLYYLAQIITGTDCESEERTKITVTINTLPATDKSMEPVAICSGGTPSIKVNNTVSGFKYRVYGTPTNGTPISGEASGNGDDVYILTSTAITSDTTYYVETENASGCVSQSRTPVEINVTNLYIQPDRLPPYKRGVPYDERLSSNASQPSYRIVAGDLPAGFALSLSGEIGGTVSAVGSLERKTFTVEVEDNAGCTVEKEYVLEFATTVSEIFTPNGDGVNDVFMKGCRITVFDRLGKKVFDGDDGWDGTYNGAPIAGDTYFYVLHYVDDKGLTIRTHGSVTILR